jgi:hypothetical protein
VEKLFLVYGCKRLRHRLNGENIDNRKKDVQYRTQFEFTFFGVSRFGRSPEACLILGHGRKQKRIEFLASQNEAR